MLGRSVAALLAAASLPGAPSGHRPGPDVLYAPPPRAPQLENVKPFKAPPILVSGATAYRDGEFIYQDFLHDDRGAAGVGDPTDPLAGGTLNWKSKAGTLTYPTDPVYANNAADLVEVRVKPLRYKTALRVTLNTMLDPQKVAFTVALGDSAQPVAWPHGANVSSPAQLFLTVHGDTAELTGRPAPAVTVDRERRQFTVRIPHSSWDPGTGVVRMAAGVGLWGGGGYLQPTVEASATQPGGVSRSRAALFNMAFRTHEPLPTGPSPGVTLIDSGVLGAVNAAWWRELEQSQALASGDVSEFAAQVDFGKLVRREDDDSQIPRTGPVNRILAGIDRGQGVQPSMLCGRFPAHCDGAIPGQLQAYTVYVPAGKHPARWGMTLLLHALNENENQYDGWNYQRQLGERGDGYLVVTPSGRGPDGDYTDAAETNVFQTWADVARHYKLDPARTTLSGWSMGGGGSFRLASRWPDLFARAAAVGAAVNPDQTGYIPALRNNPTLTWVASGDEGTTPDLQQQAIDLQTQYGQDFTFDQFLTGDHATVPLNDQFQPFADFLGDHRADLDPPHVTYGVVPGLNFPGVEGDHAYWVSGLKARDPKVLASIDVRSEGFGLADPVATAQPAAPGVLTGGRFQAMAYLEHRMTRAAPAAADKHDRLVIVARNLASVTIDAGRAHVSCAPELAIDSDGPLAVNVSCPLQQKRRRR